MFDHAFAQLIAALRRSLEAALLQRQAVEERFQVDVFLGDVSFETSYSLPGEQRPARIRVDIGLDWPTWSQTSYRSWSMGEEPEEQPEVLVEIAFRVQELAEAPDVAAVTGTLPTELAVLGDEPIERGPATVERREAEPGGGVGGGVEHAVEVSFEGSCPLDEGILDDTGVLDDALAPLGRAVASVLIRLADLPLVFRTPAGGAG